jgi:hypothetical protein
MTGIDICQHNRLYIYCIYRWKSKPRGPGPVGTEETLREMYDSHLQMITTSISVGDYIVLGIEHIENLP